MMRSQWIHPVGAVMALSCLGGAGWAQTSSRAVVASLDHKEASYHSAPQSVTWAGGKIYFAQETSYGRELFVSDGSAAGTRMVVDLAPGARGGLTQAGFVATAAAPQLWFVAENGIGTEADPANAGRELWLTDGSAAGTRLVKDIQPGAVGSGALAFQWFRGAGYFLVRNAAGRQVIYRSDGTNAGTAEWFDFTTATDARTVVNMLAGTARLWISVRNTTSGRLELWSSDGEAAPSKVADFASGPILLGVGPDDRVYFAASDGATGSEWWTATPSGVTLLGDLIPGPTGSGPTGFAVLPSGEVLTSHGVQSSHPAGLWKTNGTPGGTVKISDVSVVGNTFPSMVRSGNLVYFVGQPASGQDFGLEVWRTDGTPAGTRMVRDVVPGGGAATKSPVHLTDFNGVLFFTAGDGTYWKSDGTEAGTVPAGPSGLRATITGQTSMPAVAGSWIYFPAIDEQGPGLFRSDGTVAGTQRVFGPTSAPAGWGPGQVLQEVAGRVYFVGRAVDELWRTDGSPEGTFSLGVELANLRVPPTLAGVGSTAFFAGLPDGSSRLWLGRTDGTVAGTHWVKDIGDAATGDARLHGAVGADLHFSVTAPATGWEPWVSDGSAGGTGLAADVFPGGESSHPASYFPHAGAMYFAADSGPEGMELWRRAGAPPVVSLFANLATDGEGPNGSHPRDFTALAGRFLFSARSESGGRRVLWMSDGTSGGTQPVECAADDPSDLVELGGHVYFAGTDGRHGRELWRSDGTASGTGMVVDLRPGAGVEGSSNPRQLVVAGAQVFFVADDGVHGDELWASDGTPAGTRMVKDIFPGLAGASPSLLVRVGDRVAFTALDATHGREVWVSDGTAAGTTMPEDLHPGPFDAGVVKLAATLNGVFFFAPTPGAAHPGLRFLPLGP